VKRLAVGRWAYKRRPDTFSWDEKKPLINKGYFLMQLTYYLKLNSASAAALGGEQGIRTLDTGFARMLP
jgi:hypothetical protein